VVIIWGIYALITLAVWCCFLIASASYPFSSELEKLIPSGLRQFIFNFMPFRVLSDTDVKTATNLVSGFLLLLLLSFTSILLHRLLLSSGLLRPLKAWAMEKIILEVRALFDERK
jgi:hypothetical protein